MWELLTSYDGLYAFGRDALFWGLKSLDLLPGTCVWMPSFHCGVEVQTALDAGLDVDFYRVGLDLALDEDDLERKLAARPGPVMLIHYFGFPQPGVQRVADLCRRLGVSLIEDCSHALFSSFANQPVGQFGRVAAYSLYKTLGLCDGGALVLNREMSTATRPRALEPAPPPKGRASLYGYKIQARALVKKTLGAQATRWYRSTSPGVAESATPVPAASQPATHPLIDRPHDYRRAMSALSRRLASTMDTNLILRQRRENWRFLDDRLSPLAGYRRVFDVLQEGVCPLYLPLWVSRREMLSSKLMSHGIETFVFGRFAHPRMNEAQFPQAAALRRNILCLPLHQYMDEAQLTRLTGVVGPLLAEHAVETEVDLERET